MICMRCLYACPHKAIFFNHADFISLDGGYDIKEFMKSQGSDYLTKNSKGFYKHFIHYIEDESI